MVCVVKVLGDGEAAGGVGRFVPACATIVADGMRLESETTAVHDVRRTALELLLSDHVGECRAPCQYADPFDVDIPALLRHIHAGRICEASELLRREMPLAGVLARIEPDPSERGCRRCATDESASIGLLKQHVADNDLEHLKERPNTSPCATALEQCDSPREDTADTAVAHTDVAASGKRIAIIGSGPAGLSAAYFLLRGGHACTIFEKAATPGGTLRTSTNVPPETLAAEIELLKQRGAKIETNVELGTALTLDKLQSKFDAVLVATGEHAPQTTGQIDPVSHMTQTLGVFAAGDIVRKRSPLRTAADGKAAAVCIDQFLHNQTIIGPQKLVALRFARLSAAQVAATAAAVGQPQRITPTNHNARGFTTDEARAEAGRCLHCDCRSLESCTLRIYAERYGADAARYRGVRRQLDEVPPHPDILFEPGKCILCGLCVQIAGLAGERSGLTRVGRGFETQLAVPFGQSLAEALETAGAQCVAVCPTGALAWRADVPPEGTHHCGCAGGCAPKQ